MFLFGCASLAGKGRAGMNCGVLYVCKEITWSGMLRKFFPAAGLICALNGLASIERSGSSFFNEVSGCASMLRIYQRGST